MSSPASPPTLPVPAVQVVSADTVYAALGDPTRRRLLQLLANGQGHTATVLARNVGKRLDATLKHLVALRGAGLVVTAENPQDGRRQLYRLNPAIPVTKPPGPMAQARIIRAFGAGERWAHSVRR